MAGRKGRVASRHSAGLSRHEGRKFGLVVGGAFLVLAGIGWWRGHALLLYIAGAIGALLFLGGLVVPHRLGPVQRAWMKLAEMISRVTTPIVLALVYFLVITPTGVLLRVFGRNPIRRTPDESGSYWIPREDGSRDDFQRQF